MSNITVYTAITGGKDKPQPTLKLPHLRHVLFADEHTGEAEGWERRGALHPPGFFGLGPARRAMWHRWTPGMAGLDGDLLWVDGNFRLLKDPTPLFDAVKREGSDIGLFAHPVRNCVYAEADAHLAMPGRFDEDAIRTQVAYYQRIGFKANAGLYMTGLLVLPENRDAWKLDTVFADILRFSYRDQIAFPCVASLLGIKLTVFPHARCSDYFDNVGHITDAQLELAR